MAGKVENASATLREALKVQCDLMGDMLTEVTGQLAALRQASDTLIEKWRTHSNDLLERGHAALGVQLGMAADELEAATKEATA